MAKQRMIKTSFWSDNYIETLDPSEKLLYLYLLTNEAVDLCGIYELSIKRISFETGFDRDMIEKLIERFAKGGKVYYIDGYVCMVNFIRHQNTRSEKIVKGIIRSIEGIPATVLEKLISVDRVWIGYVYDIAPYFTLPNLTKPNSTSLHPTQKKADEEEREVLPSEDKKAVQTEKKKKFMDHVFLTEEEHNSLIYGFGASITKKFIRKLNIDIGSKGDKYKSHYFTILHRLDYQKIKPKIHVDEEKDPPKKLTPQEKERSKSVLENARRIMASKKVT